MNMDESMFFSIDRILEEEFGECPSQEFITYAQNLRQENTTTHVEVNLGGQGVQYNGKRRPELTVAQKRQIVDEILAQMHNKILPRGSLSRLARQFGVHRSTLTRLYHDICKQMDQGTVIDVRSKKLGKVGVKGREYTDAFLQSVPLYLRTTERKYAAALKISHSTLHNLKTRGILRTHTSTNKPRLTSDHKMARLRWVLSHIEPATTTNPTFIDMSNVIHIDEKWFFLNPETRRFYLLPNEDDPYRCEQSRRFKTKAMFMGVIGKPLYDAQGTLIHDGKYGIIPFVSKQIAKKSSKNRAAGTIESKAIQNVNREEIRKMLLNEVIPAIKSKWPHVIPKNVVIQWDNARPHQVPKDEEFLNAISEGGFNFNFVFQPAQSPDLNVLDLGIFRVIQSIQHHSFPRNLDEMIEKVKEAYDEFEPIVNKHTWITLQSCMIEILKVEGGNKYKIPHMGKQRLERLGLLPELLEVSREVIQQAVNFLNNNFIETNQDQQGGMEFEVDAD